MEMADEPLTAIVSMETPGCMPSSYVIRIYEGWGKRFIDLDEEELDWIAEYDTNTINLRAAVEYLGMVTRKHNINSEAVHFRGDCEDLELMWQHYTELR